MPLLCPGNGFSKVCVERVAADPQTATTTVTVGSDSHIEVAVVQPQEAFFPLTGAQNGASSSSSNSRMRPHEQRDGPDVPHIGVPSLQKWFQAQSAAALNGVPKESPRFEEVSTYTATPRDVSGLVATRGPPSMTPRETPRESPRPAEEGGGGDSEELLYEGTYLGTMKHGTGRLRMKHYTYEGEFQNDMRHGIGVLEWDDGRRFEGGFREGKFHGPAVMIWPDGRKYVGQYEEDRKHGDGTFSWQDGRRYEGQWVSGKRHGIGTYTNAKGLTRTGSWQMDRPIHWHDPISVQPPLKEEPEGMLRISGNDSEVQVSNL